MQPQFAAKRIVHAVGICHIEIRVRTDDRNAALHKRIDDVLRLHGMQRVKDHRVVADDELHADAFRLTQNARRDIQAKQRLCDLDIFITDQNADVIKIHCRLKRRNTVYGIIDLSNGHAFSSSPYRSKSICSKISSALLSAPPCRMPLILFSMLCRTLLA